MGSSHSAPFVLETKIAWSPARNSAPSPLTNVSHRYNAPLSASCPLRARSVFRVRNPPVARPTLPSGPGWGSSARRCAAICLTLHELASAICTRSRSLHVWRRSKLVATRTLTIAPYCQPYHTKNPLHTYIRKLNNP